MTSCLRYLVLCKLVWGLGFTIEDRELLPGTTAATMTTVEYEVKHVPDQLVDQLVKGYDALSTEIRTLDEQRQELENKLAWTKQQVRSTIFILHLVQ